MTDAKPPLEQFFATIWGKVSAFIGAVATLVGFFALWKTNFAVVGIITFGLITLLLAVGSFGWHTKHISAQLIPPKPAETRKLPLLSPGWLKITRIIFGIAVLGWIFWGFYRGYIYLNEKRQIVNLESKVVILIAEIDGPDPKKYRVTEELISQLGDALANYNDIYIISLGEIITEHQGSSCARDIGQQRHADIVLWGYYGATETDVRLTLHV